MNGTIVDTLRLDWRWRRIDVPAIEGTRSGISIVDLPSTRVRIRVAGAGAPTLVFACDPPNVVEQYDEIIARLADRHRIVVLEQPGMGFSFPKPGFGFTLREYVDALVGLLRRLDMAPYVPVFPCASAFTALCAAGEQPSLISRLVMMQATEWAQQKRWLEELARVMGLIAMGIPVVGNTVIGTPFLGQVWSACTERWFPQLTTPPSVYRAKKRPDFEERFMAPHRQAFAQGACNCQVSMYQHYFAGDDAAFPRPAQPALVVFGSKDISHDNTYMRQQKGVAGILARAMSAPVQSDKRGLLRYVPHATFVEVPETGHFLELENAEAVCGAIGRFLAQP